MSVYTPGIPNATDLISSSQQPIKDNFGQLNTQFGVDHNPFWTGSANGNGHHKQVNFDSASAVPNPLTTASAIYPAADGVSTNQEMFWANRQFKQATAIQVTNSALIATAGNGMLPGGLEIRSGRGNSGLATSVAVGFSPAFPVAVVSVVTVAEGTDTNQSCQPSGISGSGFTLTTSKTSLAFSWIAIGY